VKIGPVFSAENRLTNANCVACSRGSAYYVEYLQICLTDFCNLFTIWKHCMYRWWICTIFSNISRDVAMATKSFVNVRYNTAKKLAYFVKIFPDILDLFSQSFHHMKDLPPWLSGLAIAGRGAVKAWLAIRQGVGSYPTPAGMSSQVSAWDYSRARYMRVRLCPR